MRKNLLLFSLVAFGSFCLFTALFHTLARAQTGMFTAAAPLPSKEPTKTPLAKAITTSTPSTVPLKPKTTRQPTTKPTTLPVGRSNPTQTPVPTKEPTPEPTAIPTIVPTTTPQPTTAVVTDLETLFTKYSNEYSVDKELLKKIANCESGFNPNAENGPYIGMYQFMEQTWMNTRSTMNMDSNPDLRRNAEESIRTAAFMISRGQQNAWANCL